MITITSDFHCHNHSQYARTLDDGTNSRLQSILDCIDWILAESRDRGADKLIVAGDIFHARKSIEHTVLDRVYSKWRDVEDIFDEVFVVTGNHDMSVSGDGSLSIRGLESQVTTVFSEPFALDIEGVPFGMLPYTEEEGELEDALELFDNARVKYIVGHLGVLGGLVGPSDFEVPGKFSPEALAPTKGHDWKVFLGHFHKHQDVDDRITYIGSPLQLGWGERGEEKGFIMLNPRDGSTEFVENTESPRFLLLERSDLHLRREKDYVRVLVPEGEAVPAEPDSNVRVEIVREASSARARLDLAGQGDREMLQRYVKHQGTKVHVDMGVPGADVSRKQLVEAGMGFLGEVVG